MANDFISTIAQSLGKLDEERQQEFQNLKKQVQKQHEEISSLRDTLVKLIGRQETHHKVAGIWDPDEYILSTDKRLWGESGLFRSRWAF